MIIDLQHLNCRIRNAPPRLEVHIAVGGKIDELSTVTNQTGIQNIFSMPDPVKFSDASKELVRINFGLDWRRQNRNQERIR